MKVERTFYRFNEFESQFLGFLIGVFGFLCFFFMSY